LGVSAAPAFDDMVGSIPTSASRYQP